MNVGIQKIPAPAAIAFVSLNAAITAACWQLLEVVNDPVTVEAAPRMMYWPTVRTATLVLTQRVMPPRVVIVPMVEAFNRAKLITSALAEVGVISEALWLVLFAVIALLPVTSSGVPVEMPVKCASPIDPDEAPLSEIEIRVEAELIPLQYHNSAPATGLGVPRATASVNTFVVLSVTDVTVTAELAGPIPTISAPPPTNPKPDELSDHVDAAVPIVPPVELMNVILPATDGLSEIPPEDQPRMSCVHVAVTVADPG